MRKHNPHFTVDFIDHFELERLVGRQLLTEEQAAVSNLYVNQLKQRFLSKIDQVDELYETEKPFNIKVIVYSLEQAKKVHDNPEAYTGAFIRVGEENILVVYDTTPLSEIAHECKHMLDTMSGKLVTNQDMTVTYEGTTYERTGDSEDILSYVNQPWERAAYEFMLKYCTPKELTYYNKILNG